MMALAEAHLVELARAGDIVAFETLRAPHAGRVRARAYRITRNKADIEEVVQDVPTPESEFLSRETRWLLRAAIDRLSAPRQLALRLMTLEGFSCERPSGWWVSPWRR